MNTEAEHSRSFWMESVALPDAPRLAQDMQADTVIVGSGIAGLTAAHELQHAGQKVIVVDRGRLCSGMSARTSAHLTVTLDDLYQELISLRGQEEARLYFQSQLAAVGRIETMQKDEGIDCDFTRLDGYLFAAKAEDQDMLEKEIEACHQLEYRDVAWVNRAPVPGRDTGRALRFPFHARFHPLKYLTGVVKALREKGVQFYADTAITTIEEKDGLVTLATENGPVLRAKSVIVATNSPINNLAAIHSKQAPYRTYVIAGKIPKGSVADALIWDTEEPYHYVRIQPIDAEHDLLISGGEDHKSGEADDMDERLARLERWTRDHFPGLGSIDHQWSGQIMDPVDYLPYIGRNPGNERVFIITGDSGQGLTNGTVGGMVTSALILRGDHPWQDLFDPSRKTLGAASTYVSENTTVVTNMAEYVTPGEISSTDELKPGEGAIIRRGLSKIAACRDENGAVHEHSAVCTHLGCIVHWNSFEQCWDCPCHGSQFAPTGEVLNGPAIYPLAKAEN